MALSTNIIGGNKYEMFTGINSELMVFPTRTLFPEPQGEEDTFNLHQLMGTEFNSSLFSLSVLLKWELVPALLRGGSWRLRDIRTLAEGEIGPVLLVVTLGLQGQTGSKKGRAVAIAQE